MCRNFDRHDYGYTQTDVWITLGEEDLEDLAEEVGDGGGDGGGTSVALVTVSSRLVTGPLTLMMWVLAGAPTVASTASVLGGLSLEEDLRPLLVGDSTAMTVVTWGGVAGLVDVEDLDDEVTDDLEARWLFGEAVAEPLLRLWMGEGEHADAGNLSLVDEARLRLSSSTLSRWSSLDLEDSNLSRSSSPL